VTLTAMKEVAYFSPAIYETAAYKSHMANGEKRDIRSF